MAGMTDRTCSVDGCGRPFHARERCRGHYEKWKRENLPPRSFCTIEDCDLPHVAKGKCRKHYYQAWQSPGECSVDGCDSPHYGKGYCQKHYVRWRKTGSTDDPVQVSRPQVTPKGDPVRATECSADGCERPPTRRGMCEMHYRRWWRVEFAEQIAATRKAYATANWEKVRASFARTTAKRTAKKAAAIEPVDYERILATYGMVCHICNSPIPSRADLHFDHVIPLTRDGGDHVEANIRPAHARCNMSKGNKLMSELDGVA